MLLAVVARMDQVVDNQEEDKLLVAVDKHSLGIQAEAHMVDSQVEVVRNLVEGSETDELAEAHTHRLEAVRSQEVHRSMDLPVEGSREEVDRTSGRTVKQLRHEKR